MTGEFAGTDLLHRTIAQSARMRGRQYREEAARFRRMAEAETNEKLCRSLAALAQQYEELADSLDGG